jgi:hypothetical protein
MKRTALQRVECQTCDSRSAAANLAGRGHKAPGPDVEDDEGTKAIPVRSTNPSCVAKVTAERRRL